MNLFLDWSLRIAVDITTGACLGLLVMGAYYRVTTRQGRTRPPGRSGGKP